MPSSKADNKGCSKLVDPVNWLTDDHSDKTHSEKLLACFDHYECSEKIINTVKLSDSNFLGGWRTVAPCAKFISNSVKKKRNHEESTVRIIPYRSRAKSPEMTKFSDLKSCTEKRTYRYIQNNSAYRLFKVFQRHPNGQNQAIRRYSHPDKVVLSPAQQELQRDIKEKLQREYDYRKEQNKNKVTDSQRKSDINVRDGNPQRDDGTEAHNISVTFSASYPDDVSNSKCLQNRMQSQSPPRTTRSSQSSRDFDKLIEPIQIVSNDFRNDEHTRHTEYKQQQTFNKIQNGQYHRGAVEFPPIESSIVHYSKPNAKFLSKRIVTLEEEIKKDKMIKYPSDNIRSHSEPVPEHYSHFLEFSGVPPQYLDGSNDDFITVKPIKHKSKHTNKKNNSHMDSHQLYNSQSNTPPADTQVPGFITNAKKKSKRTTEENKSNQENTYGKFHGKVYQQSPDHNEENDIVNYVKDVTEINKLSAKHAPVIVRNQNSRQNVRSEIALLKTPVPIKSTKSLPKPEPHISNEIVAKVSTRSMHVS